MAQVAYTVQRGQGIKDVVISAGSAVGSGGGVQLIVDDAGMSATEVYQLIEVLEAALLNNLFPAL